MMKKMQALMDRLMFKIVPTCRETMKLHSEALDHRLPPMKRIRLWMHCTMCAFCRRYGQQIGWLHRILKQTPAASCFSAQDPMSPEMKNRVRIRIQNEMGH